jgi:replicative DNA helicase
MEQNPDVVALLHREREKQQNMTDDNVGLNSELIIAKNRNGGTGTTEMLFFPKYTRFENKAQIPDSDIPSGV